MILLHNACMCGMGSVTKKLLKGRMVFRALDIKRALRNSYTDNRGDRFLASLKSGSISVSYCN